MMSDFAEYYPNDNLRLLSSAPQANLLQHEAATHSMTFDFHFSLTAN
jgi:hypothetical protein